MLHLYCEIKHFQEAEDQSIESKLSFQLKTHLDPSRTTLHIKFIVYSNCVHDFLLITLIDFTVPTSSRWEAFWPEYNLLCHY